MTNIQGKNITILGAQKSAMALAHLIATLNGIPRISEKKALKDLDETFRTWLEKKSLEVEFGGHTQDFIAKSDLIVLSPGVPFQSEALEWARAKKIPIVGEIEFSFQFCPVPVVSITGSNGKTTVSTLIKLCLEEAGLKTCLCGNIGDPFAANVFQLKGYDYVVLEVSSFQMESLLPDAELSVLPWNFKGFKPHVAVFTNFSQNHLDRHANEEEYFQAKFKMFQHQDKNDFAVLNFKDSRHQALDGKVKSKILYFNKDNKAANNPNQLAVLKVAEALGIKADVCQTVFENFKGVEHRLEWVRNLNGVDFINDSKSTTAEATRWALNSIDKPILMICGGRDKHIDFTVMRDLVNQKVKKMYVIGEAKEKIKQAFEGAVTMEDCADLKNAVERAQQEALIGEVVLLSPMCTSFDMFKNFEDRGRKFKIIVNDLKLELIKK